MPTFSFDDAGAFSDRGSFADLPGFVFDTETTGVDADSDRVVELGAISVARGQLVDERRMRINPERPIPPGASAIHGISDADVAQKPTFAAVAERFALYFDGSRHGGVLPWLAGYNATGFDVPLLNAEFARIGSAVRIDVGRVVDPMIFVRWHLRHLRSRSLVNICQHFAIDAGRAHSALDDARATANLLFRLITEGFIPNDVAAALQLQAQIAPQLQAEWQDFAYWLYHDRADGRLRLGAGSHIGTPVEAASPDYLRSLLAKVSDLPQRVRDVFLDAASRDRPRPAALPTDEQGLQGRAGLC